MTPVTCAVCHDVIAGGYNEAYVVAIKAGADGIPTNLYGQDECRGRAGELRAIGATVAERQESEVRHGL